MLLYLCIGPGGPWAIASSYNFVTGDPKVNSVSATGLLKGYQVSSGSSAGLVNQVQARSPTNPTLEYYYIGEMVLPWNSEV